MTRSFLLSLGKSAVYFTESLPLLFLSEFYIKNKGAGRPQPEQLKILFKEIFELHKWDEKNIRDGVYPKQVVDIGSPIKHGLKLFKVLGDAVKVAHRMKTKKHDDFSESATKYLDEVPEYYSRNFHFQTDGYLSDFSAQIYDHQVEILFNGTAQTMRRLSLPPLREKYSNNERIDILDVACGPGSLTRDLAMTFPNANITAIDLSFPYLKEAQKKLKKFPRINFLQGNAEELPFRDQSFDAVTCSYLFHELPLKARQNVIKECLRVLKPGGIVSFVDSIQSGDSPHLDWALQRFAISYHEPFYTNYLKHPLQEMLQEAAEFNPTQVKTQIGFFSKNVSLQKETLS